MKPIQFAKLSDICRIESGGTPSSSDPSYWDGNIPWVTLVDVRNKYVETTTRRISLSGLKNSSATVLPVGTVLFSSRATIGNVSIAKIELATNQGFKNFICDENKLIPEYLYYFLNYEAKRIEASCPGTTYKEISKSKIGKYTIPLPSLDDQKRIVEILGQSDALRQRRKQSIEFLDDYLKSVFLEMFGDPQVNPKGFPLVKLQEFYVDLKNGTKCGPFGSALKKEEFVDDGVPVWNMDNISMSGQMLMPFRMWITEEKYRSLEAYSVLEGDVLISRAGTVGKMCVVRNSNHKSIISTNLIRVRFGNRLLPLYFVSLMTYCKGRVGRLKTGADGAFTHMNTGVLDALTFPYPPLGLQKDFAAMADKVESLKQKMFAQSEQLEKEFQSLMQKAFKGEL